MTENSSEKCVGTVLEMFKKSEKLAETFKAKTSDRDILTAAASAMKQVMAEELRDVLEGYFREE